MRNCFFFTEKSFFIRYVSPTQVIIKQLKFFYYNFFNDALLSLKRYERQETETDSPCYDAGSYDEDSYHQRHRLFYPQQTKVSQIEKESALQNQSSLPPSSPIHASSSSRQIPISTDPQSHRHLSNSRDDVSRSLDDKNLKQVRPEFLRLQPGNRNSEQRRSCPEVGRVVMRKDSYKIGGRRVAKSYVESDL